MYHQATITCPNCGNDLPQLSSGQAAFCPHCGGSITSLGVTQVNISGNVQNLLGLAQTAALAGNAEEAYNYSNRVLEIDPRNVTAWIRKGESAGWMSTLQQLRLNEMIVAFQAAESFADPAEVLGLRAEFAQTMNNVAVAIVQLSQQQLTECAAIDGVWVQHIAACLEVLDLLEQAHNLVPDDRQVMENVIHVAGELIRGHVYIDFDNLSKLHSVTPEAAAQLQSLIDRYGALIRGSDPNYLVPKPTTQSAGPCFVVTATMGSEDSYPIRELRRFRDDVLLPHSVTRCWVKWYYREGPRAARLIAPSAPMRLAAFVFVVMPALALAIPTRFLATACRRRHSDTA